MVSSITMQHQRFNLISVICLHTGKWLNSSIWPVDGTLTGITAPSQSGSGYEGVLYILKSFRTETSLLDVV